ncbi:MAG TPA: hypothetical protein VMI06_10360 [Terriglobia bacterium]|nr:hypothetical protein [Terriglobia bacterium]
MNRRDFAKGAVAGSMGLLAASAVAGARAADKHANSGWRFSSPSIAAELSDTAPGLVSLNIDGLGLGKRGANVLQPRVSPWGEYTAVLSASSGSLRAEYRSLGQPKNSAPPWTIEVRDRRILLSSRWNAARPPQPLALAFDLSRCYSTLLGIFGADGGIRLPAVLHLPLQGSVRISSSRPAQDVVGYTASRDAGLTVTFPSATASVPQIEYRLEVAAIYPQLEGINGDRRFDSFKRNWLNILQLNPDRRLLSNNSTSSSCAFCYYEYADIAANSPPLVEGLSALDLARQALDRILAGADAYGLRPSEDFGADASDSLPSLLITAYECVRTGQRDGWLAANYEGIRHWADGMLSTVKDPNGMVEYAVSGNSGIWPNGAPPFRPSNWWDTIGFGHQDAYSNALAWRALEGMADMARRMGKHEDIVRYRAAAEKIHTHYFRTFYDPQTGVIAGWKSADGKLHDYYFLWVNGIAVLYHLVPRNVANSIMKRLLAKMQEVGFTNFSLGLPGNLITVALKDCVDKRGKGRFGCGVRPDNSDGFQKYENGGATSSFAYFFLAALYHLGMREEGDRILFPILEAIGKGGFQGYGPNGRSYDWRTWDGTPMGYEGLLTDNYYTLLAVVARQQSLRRLWRGRK